MIRSTATVSSTMRMPRSAQAASRARSTSRPVASLAWATRRREWPPSRVRWSCSGPFAVELHAERAEPADALRPLAHRDLDRLALAEAGAGDQGVLDVELEAVVGAEHRGDAALGVLGGALGALPLGEDQHRAVAGGLEGEGEAGDAAAQHQEVDLLAG